MPATEDAVFDALADPTRRALMTLLGAAGAGSTPTELSARLPVTRQAVSKHLAVLAAADLVTSDRAGREIRYRLTPAPMSAALAWMATVGGEWDERLGTLARRLGERS